jgi:acetolactate synthase-1/2/3 large subunit
LIIVGSDAYYNNSGPDLVRFAERFSIPVQTPIWDRGVFDRPSPAFIGVIGAASGGPALLQNADCVVLAGAEPDYRVGFLQPGSVATEARVVRLDSGWDRLTDLYGGPVHAAWLGEVRKLRREFRAQVEHKGAAQARAGLHAMHAVEAIRQVLTLDTLLLIDGGSIGQWAHQLLCDRYPGHWLTCGRSGVVGWGLGGAMAARLAYPDSPVLLLSGDGAFTFTVAEIECAVRQKLPFVAMVVDDQAWGITHAGHLREFGEGVSTVLGPIAFDRLAESLGARGRKALTPEQITAELKDALERPEVTVIHIPVVNGNPL